jgi:PKD repeat protein
MLPSVLFIPGKVGAGITGKAGGTVAITTAVATVASVVNAQIATPYGTQLDTHTALHVNALGTALASGTALTAKYVWDFGDPAGKYNTYDGFNAAHVFSAAGAYTVTLTVTDAGGTVAKTTLSVNVAADNRRRVYVSAAGSDANDGSSDGRAVATLGRALAIAGSNVDVLLRAGDTWNLTGAMNVSGQNVYIGSYGSGAQPTLRQASTSLGDLILLQSSARNVMVEGINFDCATPTNLEKGGAARAVKAAGTNIVVRGCTFTNVADAVNGEQSPSGVLVQDNTAPTVTSVRAYFDWVQGADWVILGNTAPNSTREHIIRVGGADHVNAQFNQFSNQDRTAQGDSKDIAKGVFTLQVGTYINIENNNMWWGPVGVGPLGGVDGVKTPDAKTSWVVFRSNVLYGASMNVSPGCEHVLFQDNVVTSNGGVVFNVVPLDTTRDAYGNLYYPNRNLLDVSFDHNTGFNNSNNGRFLYLKMASNPGVLSVTSNLYVSPKLETGYNQNAVMYVGASDLSSFASIAGNIWQSPVKSPGSSGAAMYVWPSWWDSRGYLTPTQWLAKGPTVRGDVFSAVSMADSSYAVTAALTATSGAITPTYSTTVNGVTAGSRVRR